MATACSPIARAQSPTVELRGQVLDEDSQPVARVEIVEATAESRTEPVYTNVAGRFEIDFPTPRSVLLNLSKPGFFRIDQKQIDLSEGVNEVTISLNHE